MSLLPHLKITYTYHLQITPTPSFRSFLFYISFLFNEVHKNCVYDDLG